jgi:hypothetical protein
MCYPHIDPLLLSFIDPRMPMMDDDDDTRAYTLSTMCYVAYTSSTIIAKAHTYQYNCSIYVANSNYDYSKIYILSLMIESCILIYNLLTSFTIKLMSCLF